jgi:uncharacterized protein YjaZ
LCARPIRALAILVVLSLVAGGVGCGSPDGEREFSRGEQEFRIVPAYEGQARYLQETRSDPEADPDALWREHVVERYCEDCLEGEYERLAERRLSEPVLGLDRLEGSVEALRDSDVERVVEGALGKSSQKLPGPDTTVCVFVADDRQASYSYQEGAGVEGFTAGSGRIMLFVAPEAEWRKWLPYLTAHEYHHSAWTHLWTEDHPGGEPLSELADYLVFEGRADSFAHILYPERSAPWTRALSSEEEERLWKAMKKDLGSSDQGLWVRYAFGGDEAPRWTLYTVGFHVVQGYLERHPEQDVKGWTTVEAREIVEESGYEGGVP